MGTEAGPPSGSVGHVPGAAGWTGDGAVAGVCFTHLPTRDTAAGLGGATTALCAAGGTTAAEVDARGAKSSPGVLVQAQAAGIQRASASTWPIRIRNRQ